MGQQVECLPAIPTVLFFHSENQPRIGLGDGPLHRATGGDRDDLRGRFDTRRGDRLVLDLVYRDARVRGDLEPGGGQFAVSHGGVDVTEILIRAFDKHGDIDDVARTRFDDVHVAAVWARGRRRAHAGVRAVPMQPSFGL